MAGPSLLTIRQFMAQEAGPFLAGTSDANTTSSLLSDATFPFKSSISQDSLFKDMWVFMPGVTAADKVRIIKTYTPSAGTGTYDLVHSIAHTSAPYELHGIFEPLTTIPLLINEGLKECMIPVEFSFVPSSQLALRQSLATAAPWLTNPAWIRKVGVLNTGLTRNNYEPYSATWRGGIFVDGATLYLEGQFNTSDTVYVKALKPAYFHCTASGGSYGSQSGLSLETDTVPDTVTVEWAAYAGLVCGWRRYGQILAANDKVKMSYDEAKRNFMDHDPDFAESEDDERTFTPLGRWGPPAA